MPAASLRPDAGGSNQGNVKTLNESVLICQALGTGCTVTAGGDCIDFQFTSSPLRG